MYAKVYEALDSQNSAKIDASVRACLVTIHGYSGLFVTIRDCRPTVTTVTCPALPWRLRPGSIDFQSTEITSCPAPSPSPAKQSKTFAAAKLLVAGSCSLACIRIHWPWSAALPTAAAQLGSGICAPASVLPPSTTHQHPPSTSPTKRP